jgi:hypothetical protein
MITSQGRLPTEAMPFPQVLFSKNEQVAFSEKFNFMENSLKIF